MSESVPCRGCGRRLTLPPTINRAKARCPKCRTKVEPPPATPEPRTPDAYQIFSESQAIPHIVPPAAVAPRPAPAPIPPPAPPPSHPPPPFRVPVHVLTDSLRQFHGAMQCVLTPHGLFLESKPAHPLLYIPVGIRSTATGSDLAIDLPGRWLELRIAGTRAPADLAADTAAFLAGQRPVPLPAEYLPPAWLLGVGAIFAFGLSAGPVILAAVSEQLSIGPGIAVAVAFALFAMLINAGIARSVNLPTGAKIGAMAVANVVLLALVLAGAMRFLRDEEPPPASPPPVETPPPAQPAPQPMPPPPSEPPPPTTHNDFLLRDGRIRLEDGPADVTALTNLPAGGGILVAHADGSTRIWNLEQPAFEPPRLGPHAPSAIRRIAFDPSGKIGVFTCDTGLVLANLNPPSRTPLLVPGEFGAALFENNRDRFAIVRDGKVHMRYLPMSLLEQVPPGRAKNGFVTTISQDEMLPLNVPPLGLAPPGGKPMFLAWHPGGRLIAGRTDGTIASLALGTVTPFASNEHKAAVRAWDLSTKGDFAFGDADGFVGFWPNRTTKITKFRTGTAAIRHVAFNSSGGELAVVDAAGKTSLWSPETGKPVFDVKLPQAMSVAAFGPHGDVLVLGSGRGVHVWRMLELERQGAGK